MRVCSVSETGKVRDTNEDSYCAVVHPDFTGLRLVAVADGMGGHRAGEVASKLATDFLCDRFQRLLDLARPQQWLTESIQAANEAVVMRAQQALEVAGMGTTLTAALLVDHGGKAGQLPKSTPVRETGLTLFTGHVGDSRLYAYHKAQRQLQQLTDDHSLVAELVRNGELTEEEAQHHPQRNYLTQALGTKQTLEVDSGEFLLESGDIVILCTDGLSTLLTQDDMLQVLKTSDIQASAARLVELALARGGPDNITVILIET